MSSLEKLQTKIPSPWELWEQVSNALGVTGVCVCSGRAEEQVWLQQGAGCGEGEGHTMCEA